MSPRIRPRLSSSWLLLPLFAGLAAPAVLRADVVPSPLFQDHAVLQRGKPVPVWGRADAGETVSVSFAGQTKSTTAGADGRWSVTLDPLAVNAEPATLTIAGKNTVTFSDVLVGEVWLASGQSNMEWSVDNANDSDMTRRTARFPLIREIKVKRTVADAPAETFEGAWRVASPETVGAFSVVAYSFARDVHLALDGVPVGIVNSTWGGTPVESWMSPATLASDPAFAGVAERWSRVLAEYPAKKAEHDAAMTAWRTEKAAAEAAGERFTKSAPRGPTGPGSPWTPSGLHNGMIAPLQPFALRGAIWYQGESNADRAAEYHGLFSAMIRGWRGEFGQGDFPFFWVQLAAFRASGPEATDWADLREAQARTLELPATGQAIAIDAPASDFGDIHPRDKATIGRRLARLALNRVYGDGSLADSGPVFAGTEPVAAEPATETGPGRPAALRVNFSGVNGRVRQPLPTVTGFEIAGEDRVFHPAEARTERGSVVVWSSAVPAPVAVRYAWRNHPVAWLQDDLGLPVPPFRSDTW